jgi:hypothetical protein
VAGGKSKGLLFRSGQPAGWYAKEDILKVLMAEVEKMASEYIEEEGT